MRGEAGNGPSSVTMASSGWSWGWSGTCSTSCAAKARPMVSGWRVAFSRAMALS